MAALGSRSLSVVVAESAASPAVPSDVELMQRAALGEVNAFAQLYDRHAVTVLALAGRVLRDGGDAQDLLHDVFLEAWLHAREYDAQRGSVRTWLLVRARSRALDRRGRSERDHDARTALSHDRAVMPQTERQLALRQALATLEPAVREVLELTYFEGMTALEVATLMGTPEGTVKSRLARGLDSLQRVLSLLGETQP